MRKNSLWLASVLLAIEFLDEFIYGARETAWPLIRTDLALSYVHVGLLLSLPDVIGNGVEILLGILGDVWKRRTLILGGGIAFALALVLLSLSYTFAPLLIAFVLLSPASGAFVSLSQATLMDAAPDRREQNMACWTLAGSLGALAGPAALGAAATWRLGWRGAFLAFGGLTLGLLASAWPLRFGDSRRSFVQSSLKTGMESAWRALRRGEVLRWLILLPLSDLMMDVLLGFLALYFVDVMGAAPRQAGLAVAVWTAAGLLGNVLFLPLLKRIPGTHYLLASAAAELALFPLALLTLGFWPKLALIGGVSLLKAGWYPVLKSGLYATMPEQSGTAMALHNVSGLVGSVIPLGLGLAAEGFGLRMTMWLLLLAPIALLLGVPGHHAETQA